MSKKLKVAIATDGFYPTLDGISITTANYAKYIKKNHGDITVITPKNPNQRDHEFDYPIYRYKSFPFTKKEGYVIGWPFKEKFRQDVRKMDFDILHSHCPLASSYFMKLVVMEQRIPSIVTYHTKYEYDIEKRVPTKLLKNVFRNLVLNNLNAADEVWLTSHGTLSSLRKMGYTGDYVLMPNGVDMPKGKAPQKQLDELRQKHDLKDDVPTLLFVGRMMWYKNIRIIIDALAKIKKDGGKFKLLMLGNGGDYAAIKRYCTKQGITPYTEFIGKINDREALRPYYGVADLFLFPSTFDTNGLVVREAAASKCPSVLTRGSCAAEGIPDDAAFLCEENADDLARVVKQVMNNKELLQKTGENAYNTIYLSWEDAVKMAYERYEKICSEWDYEDRK